MNENINELSFDRHVRCHVMKCFDKLVSHVMIVTVHRRMSSIIVLTIKPFDGHRAFIPTLLTQICQIPITHLHYDLHA